MAKPLTLTFQGAELNFFPEKVDRTKLYGSTAVEAQDETGRRCHIGTLADDGRTLIGRGGTGLATLSADGEWLEKSQLKPIDPEGKVIAPVPSTFNAPVKLDQVASIDAYLSHNVKSLYLMQSESDLAALKAELARGVIYSFPFSFRGGLEADVGFVLAGSDGNVFLAVGQPTRLHFVGLEQAQAPSDDEGPAEGEDEDELDFGMM